MAAWPLAAMLLVWSATGAEARGIDCAKAAAPIERAICADPQLHELDGTIAALYRRALKAFDGKVAAYVRADQRAWHARLLEIGQPDNEIEPECTIDDRACIAAMLNARILVLDSGAYAHSGVYRAADGRKLLLYPRRANNYALRLFDPASGRSIVTPDDDRDAASWDGPTRMMARMADANGAPLGAECRLMLTPSALEITVAQEGPCDGHAYGGTYRRLLDELLADYEIDLH
jgi:hypothetical protein